MEVFELVFLFNKAKIYSYMVAVTTVVILFVVAANMNSDDMSIQASTTYKNNIIDIDNDNDYLENDIKKETKDILKDVIE